MTLLSQGVAYMTARLSTILINILTARFVGQQRSRRHQERVVRASVRSLVLHTVLATISRCARLEDPLQLDGEAYTPK